MVENALENQAPLVSVHMITYNHNPYVIKAIEGVLNQERDFPIELLIGEDCSTDGTRDIVMDYQQKHPDVIRVVTSEQNVGIKQNSRRVYAAARGRYMAYCEGDDFWHDPAKLRMQVDYLESHPECVLVHSDCDFIYVAEERHLAGVLGDQTKYPAAELAVRLLAHDYWITTPTVCARREDVLRVRAENSYEFSEAFLMGDKQTWVELSRLGAVHYINRSLATMHRLPESATESKSLTRGLRILQSSLKLREHYIAKLGISGPDRTQILLKTGLPMLDLAYQVGDRETASDVASKLRKSGYRLSPLESLYVTGARSRRMRALVAPAVFTILQAQRIGRRLDRGRQPEAVEPM